jgi:hypothetical protein
MEHTHFASRRWQAPKFQVSLQHRRTTGDSRDIGAFSAGVTVVWALHFSMQQRFLRRLQKNLRPLPLGVLNLTPKQQQRMREPATTHLSSNGLQHCTLALPAVKRGLPAYPHGPK